MREEYDFSKAERGKFYHKDAQLHLPIYLNDQVLAYLKDRAKAKGVEVNQLVNDMLAKEIEIIEAVK